MIEIRLDPIEIMDRIDDMLAWEAIASESCRGYLHRHFFKAEPYISLGGGAGGLLTPSTIEAYDVEKTKEGQSWKDWHLERYGRAEKEIPALLNEPIMRAFSHATIEEHEKQEIVIPPSKITEGDDVKDLDDDGAWRDVRYCLHSVGELVGSEATPYIRAWKFPQTARVFQIQDVIAFNDGRAGNGLCVAGYWNGRLFDHNRMPLGKGKTSVNYDQFHVDMNESMQLFMLARSRWHVELSLAKQRTGVALQTDAIGAREIANMLRGPGTFAARRKTLVHWVSEHMRRYRATDPEAEIKVRAHFRGQKEFDAGRYHVRVWPSVDALSLASNRNRYEFA